MNAHQGQGRSDAVQECKSAGFDGLLNAAVTDRILKIFHVVYNQLGGGFLKSVYRFLESVYRFLESVYHRAFAMAVRQAGLVVSVQVAIPVSFRDAIAGDFVADVTVSDCVLLELKAVSTLDRTHEGQISNHLRATDFETGLLLNFGPGPRFKRLVLENKNKKIRVYPRLSAVGTLEGSEE